jgi:hypothetical protein
MHCFLRRLALAALLFAAVNFALLPMASAATMVGPSWATKIVLYNASNADTLVMVVIQGKVHGADAPPQQGCPSDIRYLRWLDLNATAAPQPLVVFTNTSTGWFILKRGHKAQVFSTSVNPVTKQASYCMQGFNIAFQGVSASCPRTSMPYPVTAPGPTFNQNLQNVVPLPSQAFPLNGVNGFEGSINLSGLTGATAPYTFASAPESVDLTCLGGANSKMVMQITPPVGGPYWNYQAGGAGGGYVLYKTTAKFQNSWVKIIPNSQEGCDDNCVDPVTGLARPGVFPYGCTTCNAFPAPVLTCGSAATFANQFCAAKNFLPSGGGGNGCQLNRSALLTQTQKFGGTILVTYVGPLSPPANCP